MPDCLIAARIANHLGRAFRESGKSQVADRFKGFDWKTEEDAFMGGYHQHEKGGEFVTYHGCALWAQTASRNLLSVSNRLVSWHLAPRLVEGARFFRNRR